ncbi:unnamed protein product [Durusdinium trenchii]
MATTSDSESDLDECSPSFLNRISVAHILLSSSRQARWAWLLLNLLSSVLVVSSVAGTVMLSVPHYGNIDGFIKVFTDLEVTASTFFILEYFLRLFVHRKKCCNYVTSFLGIIDLLVCVAAVPTLYEKFTQRKHFNFTNSHTFHVLSCFRMLRVLKLLQFVKEYQTLTSALRKELRMIVVFLFGVFTVVLILGSCLYAAERSANDKSAFSSIPAGMWWATVTLTTVGYGDLVPETVFGKIFASISMLMGYGLLAVPTIVGTLEINQLSQAQSTKDSSRSNVFDVNEASHQPLLGDDMIRIHCRALDCDRHGCLKCAAGFPLLDEVIFLWNQRTRRFVDEQSYAVEHYFRVLQAKPMPPGYDIFAKVEEEELPSSRKFMISMFNPIESIPRRIAEGYIIYSNPS